jgi:hypothetical protein
MANKKSNTNLKKKFEFSVIELALLLVIFAVVGASTAHYVFAASWGT